MSIRTASALPVQRCLDIRFDKRCGFMQEDDIVLSIRRLSLDSVHVNEFTDPNTSAVTKTRDVTFTESEVEFELWYVNYGKGFRNPEGHKEFSTSKHISYNEDDKYEDIINYCVNQSSLADLPFFVEHVADTFNYTTVCQQFPVEEP